MSAGELFSDEFGTYWVSAATLSANEARSVVEKAAGPADDGFVVSKVQGVVGSRDGEPWFTPTATGDDFWEVTER